VKIPESVRTLVGAGPLAHLTTLNPDGSPQMTVVWVGNEGDASGSAWRNDHTADWYHVSRAIWI